MVKDMLVVTDILVTGYAAFCYGQTVVTDIKLVTHTPVTECDATYSGYAYDGCTLVVTDITVRW